MFLSEAILRLFYESWYTGPKTNHLKLLAGFLLSTAPKVVL